MVFLNWSLDDLIVLKPVSFSRDSRKNSEDLTFGL